MKKLFIIILIFISVELYSQDSAKFVIDTFRVESGILISKEGIGFIPFQNISGEQLKYIQELILYFETGNRLKKWIQTK